MSVQDFNSSYVKPIFLYNERERDEFQFFCIFPLYTKLCLDDDNGRYLNECIFLEIQKTISKQNLKIYFSAQSWKTLSYVWHKK